jgi:hypothetical protein
MSDITVTMLMPMNIHGTEYLEGEEYDLPTEQADAWILKGYAAGTTSRAFSAPEIDAFTSNDQKVGT